MKDTHWERFKRSDLFFKEWINILKRRECRIVDIFTQQMIAFERRIKEERPYIENIIDFIVTVGFKLITYKIDTNYVAEIKNSTVEKPNIIIRKRTASVDESILLAALDLIKELEQFQKNK